MMKTAVNTSDLQKRASPAGARLEALTRIGFNQGTFPLAVFVTFVLGFGLFLPQLGYFWDDWVQLLSHHLYGYLAYFRYFWERPSSAWTLIVFGPLMGDSRLGWHLFTLALRYGTVLAAWWLIQLVWPRYRRDAALAALLFAVYPSFTQQAIAVDYSQQWVQYLLLTLSLLFMVLAVRREKRPGSRAFWLASLACQALQLSVTEFFIGIELIRPLLLWAALAEDPQADQPAPGFWRQAGRVLRAWAPYLLVFLGYLVWRFAFQTSLGSRNSPTLIYLLLKHPIEGLKTLLHYTLTDLKYILFSAWKRVWITPGVSALSRISFLSWGIAAVTAALAGVYLTRLKPREDERSLFRSWAALGWIGVGLVGIVLAQLPSWASGQDIADAFLGDAPHADRFTLVAMLWASLLLAGGLAWLVRSWKARALVIAVLVGILVGFQVRVANNYRWMTQSQSDFYWQLAWRAPAIQPGTALITETNPFPEQGMFATSGAINLLYPQPQNPDTVPYWVYAIQPTLYAADPSKGPVNLKTSHRIYRFDAATPDSLVFAYKALNGTCLWVLRPEDTGYPGISDLTSRWLPDSTLARIEPGPAAPGYPSPAIFGPEPSHSSWCYYFEKADLARQFGDWQAAAGLADQILAQGFSPGQKGLNAPYEWLPFLEAYARTGRWQQAAGLLRETLNAAPSYKGFLCSRWKGWAASSPSSPAAAQADAELRQGACAGK